MSIDKDLSETLQRAMSDLHLGTIREIDAVLPTFRNHSYRIMTDEGAYICREHYAYKSRHAIDWEHKVLQFAVSNGINTPLLCGTYMEQNRFFSVYMYVHGETLRNLPLTADLTYQAGTILGKIHKIFQSWKPLGPVTLSLDEALIVGATEDPWKAIQNPVIPEKEQGVLKQFLNNRDLLLRYVETSSLPQQTHVLHGDFQGGNLLVTESEWFVLDWESAFFGDPMFDVGKSLLFLCKLAEEINDYGRSKAFIRGYSAHNPLTYDALSRALWHMRYSVAASLADVLACALYADLRLIPLIQRNSQRIERIIVLEKVRAFEGDLPNLLMPILNKSTK